MAKGEKKWDAAAERDLCIAIIQSNQDGDRIRHNWQAVVDNMNNAGYTFTRDAISQHFTKVIMKDFKQRHGNKMVTPKTTPQKKKAMTSSTKRPKQEDDSDDDMSSPTPKKEKMEDGEDNSFARPAAKKRVKRERSATIMDTESAFARWEAGEE